MNAPDIDGTHNAGHRWTAVLSAAVIAFLSVGLPARSQEKAIGEWLPVVAEFFQAHIDDIVIGEPEGDPPTMRIERNGRTVGYLASTWDVARTVGYSGKPIDILVVMDTDARIVGARLIRQSEPILTIGISEADIAKFVGGFSGVDISGSVRREGPGSLPDAISGATVSSGVIADGIYRTARAVALSRRLLGGETKTTIDRTGFTPLTWRELEGAEAVASRSVSVAEARKALGSPDFMPAAGDGDSTFIDLFATLLTPPAIGQNLLGKRQYNALIAGMAVDDNAIMIAANGLYSFKGTNWRKSDVFDRVEIVQDARTIRLTKAGYQNVEALASADAPEFREAGIFVVPAASGFDPSRPWRLSLLVSREVEGGSALSATFSLAYRLPERFLVTPQAAGDTVPTETPPLWQKNWRDRIPAISAVLAILLSLYVILIFQDALAQRYRLYRIVRLTFLTVTVLVLGLALGAQLSVVQVLSYVQALRTGFQWQPFLLDPLIFIIWSWLAVALLFWGRGVFCGWLCPFGALQELTNQAARRLGLRQIEVPFALHERLWPIKYIIFLGLLALSLNSMPMAFAAAEVEPFKTAIVLKFMRDWPFVVYALGLLASGLFVERFYCRYLCPLGAALAIPARLRMFDWLKRRYECGKSCRICAVNCTVQAIHPDGHINPNECIHCLRCQTNYYDPTTCPPLKARAQRREERRKLAEAATVANATETSHG